ncbi:S41 family peptidase [Pseudoalteromonas sp. BDTF-M6]|uniref:S41 family peptidase n=1 Tax=Pseudoalteromonas sp. BDTF-M6 TaxID=2796132 RepID=UPI001BAF2A04|nr:S41 family peptidase [Pseudoalteromonas sp. BDTF-M6]MBS3798968.1 S41 family peptidase [Pseudoalteromonas sp. BDTF-M6]
MFVARFIKLTALLITVLFHQTWASSDLTAIHSLNKTITPEQMHDDIDTWWRWVKDTHPDLSLRIEDIKTFESKLNELKSELDSPLSVNEFLTHISVLNGQFNDGHMNIMIPSQRRLVEQLANDNQGLFPFEVKIREGEISIASKLGGEKSPYENARIVAINNQPIESIYTRLMSRMYGDTVRHREALLSTKFALYYWLFIGKKEEFIIEFSDKSLPRTLIVDASKSKPMSMSKPTFDDTFKFEILSAGEAKMTINEFWWHDKQAFYDFTRDAFKTIQEHNIQHLIIDVSLNRGGDDDMWKKGLLTYIADKPYRHTSFYQKKVIAAHQDEGEKIGDVVSRQYEKYERSDVSNPLHFSGKVSVIIGVQTYSSAILFANTVQDHEFGRLVGAPTGGYSWQTGGIQFFTLPNSNLRAVSPRFYLVRPSGRGLNQVVKPNTNEQAQ